jgi:hypothetical protein
MVMAEITQEVVQAKYDSLLKERDEHLVLSREEAKLARAKNREIVSMERSAESLGITLQKASQ